ncbi:3-hydroxybutyrate dehydrogenase [Pseudoalteromonas translucida KMM 520]|uniref:3-hydroxybutyrate dehydrogenase n=1 Tax=Pseudoalteromonas translucida KMM 520 TaxID=1315283 RepID=A0A0U2WRG8_9GAMM|nr:3-hydroxybutyrate dehydrogenase [Pseudoalteromonas translucida]ALS34475.1 3-hydroxybutyrate dehydrogenase [Pseudoalteromonas translucida KMM 520]
MSKTILITGAASGIGLYIAQQLAAAGHHIIVTDLNAAHATAAAERIVTNGGKAQGYALNVADSEAITAFFKQLPQAVDVLINNAGIQHVAKLEEFPADKWQFLQQVMLVGPAMMTQAVLPKMREQNFGRIINIGSIHAIVASKYKSAYVAAKHGLIGFSKTIALETGDANITINTVCPAYVKTPLVEQQIAAQAKEHGLSEQQVIDTIMLAPMPKKAFIGLDEIHHAVTFLMADAARNITAQAIAIDGGWTAQ